MLTRQLGCRASAGPCRLLARVRRRPTGNCLPPLQESLDGGGVLEGINNECDRVGGTFWCTVQNGHQGCLSLRSTRRVGPSRHLSIHHWRPKCRLAAMVRRRRRMLIEEREQR